MEIQWTYESLPKVACLAALELEQLARHKTGDAQYISLFIDLIDNNMNLSGASDQQQVEFIAIDPLTGYAMKQVLSNLSGDSEKVRTLNDLISVISTHITTPLKNIANSVKTGGSGYQEKELQMLSDICLAISKSYSSLQNTTDDFDHHPFR